jgi:hypothetical protein
MYFWSLVTSALLIILALFGCQKPQAKTFLEEYLWTHRVILVFSQEETSPNATAQLKAFFDPQTRQPTQDAMERDIKVIQLSHKNDAVRIDGARVPRLFSAPFYKKYDVERDAFRVVLIGKDGGVKLSETKPVSVDSLYSLIDSMPMRKREMTAQ